MAVVRRGAWVALRYVTTIFFLGVVVQFFLVGVGLFGMKDGATIDNAGSLDPHRGFGFILADGGALLMLVLVLLACRHLASCWEPGSCWACSPSCSPYWPTSITSGSACSTR